MSPLKEVYERFLAEEAAIRMPDVNVADRGRFHFCVLQSAVAWSRHPKANFRISRGKHSFVLHFEGPVEGRLITLFSFHSAAETGDYRFSGLNLQKLPPGTSPIARGNLGRLSDLYEAALPQAFKEDGVVGVAIRKTPAIDFLPIVDEARRVVDDGNQEFPAVDFTSVVVPTEAASLFVGKTSVSPAPRPKVKFVPPPAPVVVAPPRDPDADENDDDSESDSETDGRDESADAPPPPPAKPTSRPAAPKAKPAVSASPKPASDKKPAPAAKPAPTQKPAPAAKPHSASKPAPSAKSHPAPKPQQKAPTAAKPAAHAAPAPSGKKPLAAKAAARGGSPSAKPKGKNGRAK